MPQCRSCRKTAHAICSECGEPWETRKPGKRIISSIDMIDEELRTDLTPDQRTMLLAKRADLEIMKVKVSFKRSEARGKVTKKKKKAKVVQHDAPTPEEAERIRKLFGGADGQKES